MNLREPGDTEPLPTIDAPGRASLASEQAPTGQTRPVEASLPAIPPSSAARRGRIRSRRSHQKVCQSSSASEEVRSCRTVAGSSF